MTPSAKREVLAVLVQDHGLPIRRACQVVRLSRAAYYRPRLSRLMRDTDVVTALNDVVARHTRWGFWKCFHRLRRAGHVQPSSGHGEHVTIADELGVQHLQVEWGGGGGHLSIRYIEMCA